MPPADERARFAEGVAVANVPTLLMVLVQLTGDLRWLDEPYQPSKSRGLSDNDTGGLPAEVQAEVRAAALDAILRWRDGTPPAIPVPDEDLLVRMMRVTMGEEVPAAYTPMIAAEVSFDDEPAPAPAPGVAHPALVDGAFDAIVIGAGFSGLLAAFRFAQAGIPYTVLEKQDDVGGVWLENRYPGAAVDTPNHLYSFSFAPYDWSRFFASQAEIHAYLRWVADEFDLRRHIEFGTEVRTAAYDESAQRWLVTAVGPDGVERTRSVKVVLSAVGAFNKPKIPSVAGIGTFEGPSFHTAAWPDDLDLTGKRVAIVGNGASAMQVVPSIVDQVASLVVLQRSTQWAAPFERFKQDVPEALRFLLREVPLYYAWYRMRLAWIFNDRLYLSLQKDPAWDHPERSLNTINDSHRRQLTEYIAAELGDRQELLPKVLPTYPPFGKRMLLDNGWYRTMARDDVELVDAIAEIRPRSVVSESGSEHEVDVLVWATGFDVVGFLAPMEILGRGGVRLHDVWDGDDARAYLGTAVPGFPNFFCLYGPNSQFGHGGSVITVMERQMHYIMSLLAEMRARGLGAIEVRHDVHDAYSAKIDATHERMVWTHEGMDTYYRNSRGRITVVNPFRMLEFWQMTDRPDLDSYVLEPAVSRAHAS
jgi:4-hydroxyacetophenone monooxygenase